MRKPLCDTACFLEPVENNKIKEYLRLIVPTLFLKISQRIENLLWNYFQFWYNVGFEHHYVLA